MVFLADSGVSGHFEQDRLWYCCFERALESTGSAALWIQCLLDAGGFNYGSVFCYTSYLPTPKLSHLLTLLPVLCYKILYAAIMSISTLYKLQPFWPTVNVFVVKAVPKYTYPYN